MEKLKGKIMLLEIKHCKQALEREIDIGVDTKKRKRFTFNIWENEYTVWHMGKAIDCGQALEELLEVYNNI